MGNPPLLAEGFQENSIEEVVAPVYVKLVGGSGTVALLVEKLNYSLQALSPWLLRANTTNPY
jgi:hypothetical protein